MFSYFNFSKHFYKFVAQKQLFSAAHSNVPINLNACSWIAFSRCRPRRFPAPSAVRWGRSERLVLEKQPGVSHMASAPQSLWGEPTGQEPAWNYTTAIFFPPLWLKTHNLQVLGNSWMVKSDCLSHRSLFNTEKSYTQTLAVREML